MDKIKKYCFLFLLLLLIVPLAQKSFKFFISEPLNGMAAPKTYPVWHYKDWKEGKYQKLADNYIAGNFGFRNFLVRSLNSIDYTLFNSSNTNKLLIGKDKYLFFNYNIESYLGIRTQNRRETDSLFVMTDSLISLLDEKGIEYLFVIAPSNAFYYSDKFPDQYDRYEKNENDYDYYLSKLEEYNINYIDFNKWFIEIKDTVSIELFPQNGTHYTYFSAVWVADSMLNYMEKLKGIDIPDIIKDDYVIDTMKTYEHDLGNILNIGHELHHSDMIYYNLKFDSIGKQKPKVLTVGDSFYWPVINQMIPASCFSNVAYWFYNMKVFPESFNQETEPAEVDLDKLMKDIDFIIIYASATLLHNYDYNGFVGNMIDYFNGNYKIYHKQEEIDYWINAIKNNPDWYAKIKQKASDLNIPLDKQMRKEAEWLINQNTTK